MFSYFATGYFWFGVLFDQYPTNHTRDKRRTNFEQRERPSQKNWLTQMIESRPVCGVAIKNPTVAPSLDPCLRNPNPVGMTLQEHSGSGIPNSTDFITPIRPLSAAE